MDRDDTNAGNPFVHALAEDLASLGRQAEELAGLARENGGDASPAQAARLLLAVDKARIALLRHGGPFRGREKGVEP